MLVKCNLFDYIKTIICSILFLCIIALSISCTNSAYDANSQAERANLKSTYALQMANELNIRNSTLDLYLNINRKEKL